MAVYSKLLLSAGGGIVSTTQQAEQVKNTATVLIGLGGTGIDALRTIKTQVYSRLKADNPDAAVPRYQHIRFLGVDTTVESSDDRDEETPYNPTKGPLRKLDNTEIFSIYNPNIWHMFSNPEAMKMRDELSWVRWKDIDIPILTNSCALGIRQIGRLLMMDKSAAFMSRVEQEVNEAKAGLVNPTVNVHIFTGLSGGTGSGCFLDVCYMVQHIADKLGGATVFGYFFMPEVKLSVMPMPFSRYRDYIFRNAYAAMQELDYCMQLPGNNGAFTQKYQNGQEISWDRPPVDVCFLLGAEEASETIPRDTYTRTMDVTAQYMINWLSYGSRGINWLAARAQLQAMRAQMNVNANIMYFSIGASSAVVPFREINTYLASKLFGKFSCIFQNVPTQADVEKLAVSALARDAQSISDIYNSLYYELREGFDDSYAAYADDWKFVRDYGNREMVVSYTNQTALKLNFAEKNAKNMTSVENRKSLIGRVDAQMRKLICNINYGPMFAYGLVSAARSHNLLNVIDGLIQENNSRWEQEAAQTSLRREDYDRAKSDFDNCRKRSLFDTDAKRFGDYEYYLMLLQQHRLAIGCYEKLDQVLNVFRKQLEERTAAYYFKLNHICETLVNTFKENRDTLAREETAQAKDGALIPLMTIAELKKTLDAEIEKINVPGMLDAFMRLFLENEDTWLGEDENKITKMVNTFFVKTAFGDFANRTITSFLKDKYGISNDAQLANKIYNEWMKKLTAKASPLFYFNNGVWQMSQSREIALLFIPVSSAPIRAAADQLSMWWDRRGSALVDGISAVMVLAGFPICAGGYAQKMHDIHAHSSLNPGLYSYEGKENFGMAFNDWRKLPPLDPRSFWNSAR